MEYDAYGRPKVRLALDLNADGEIDYIDVQLFLDWYQSGDPDVRARVDLTGDGETDFTDLLSFNGLYSVHAYRNAEHSLSDGNLFDGPDNTIGYAGYHWDQELGMWLSRHRVFDPELGRWMQRDPAGYIHGMSLYEYVNENPFAFVDPTGLATWFGNAIREAASLIASNERSLNPWRTVFLQVSGVLESLFANCLNTIPI